MKSSITKILSRTGQNLLKGGSIETEFHDFYSKLVTEKCDHRFLSTNVDWSPTSGDQAAED